MLLTLLHQQELTPSSSRTFKMRSLSADWKTREDLLHGIKFIESEFSRESKDLTQKKPPLPRQKSHDTEYPMSPRSRPASAHRRKTIR